MHNFSNDYTTKLMHKVREQELLDQADQHRLAQSTRESVDRPVRRILRINNNPTR